MKYKKTIIISSAAVIFIIVISLIACNHHNYFCMHHSHQEMADFMIYKFSKELQLNDAQKKILEDSIRDIKEKHKEYKKQREDLFNNFLTEIKSDKMDEKQLNYMFEQKIQCINEMKPIAIAKLVEFHSSLSSEQKDILAKKINEKHDECKHD